MKKAIYKQSRKLGFSILENGKDLKKKFVENRHNKKMSNFGLQLREKQKIAKLYGVDDKQFKRLFLQARKNKKVVAGLALFRIFESRLDNIVFRSGFASTRREARQLVNHRHILVNNRINNFPCYLCSVNDVISIRTEKLKKNIQQKIKDIKESFPTMKVDKNNMTATFVREAERNELPRDINENLVIEWYNRRL
ncbi:MAG: 30S ribosomal protein S4 [Bacilli bacterium]|nr:30S ribosomal protein S4 [Bacilli bacterium]